MTITSIKAGLLLATASSIVLFSTQCFAQSQAGPMPSLQGPPSPQSAPLPSTQYPAGTSQAAPGFLKNAAPMQSFETPQKEVTSRGIRVGGNPSALQCTNLLRRAESVPSLKESPDYEFCKDHRQ